MFVELRKNAERMPESLAIASIEGVINYRTLVRTIDAIALRARSVDIKAGEVVLVDCQNTDARLLLALGLMLIGAVVAFGKSKGPYAAHGIRVGTVVTDDPKVAQGVRIFHLSPEWFKAAAGQTVAPALPDYGLILASSGSTGKAKPIKFSKKNLEYHINSRAGDQYYSNIPIYFSAAGNATITSMVDFLVVLLKGGTIIHSTDQSFQAVLSAINLFRPSYVSMTPILLVQVLRDLKERPRRLAKVQYLRLSGAYCSVETREETLNLLAEEVVTSFGATEIGRVAWGKFGDTRGTEGSVGRIIPGVEIETVDDEGKPLPGGGEGEIRIKIPKTGVASYPTAEGDRSPLRDGWFYPGDIGRVDPAGNLIVTGRKSLVINFGGSKVNPEVVEALLRRMDAIEDVGVLGARDRHGFDVIRAVVVARREVKLEAINTFLRSNKANFEVSRVTFVSAVPRSGSGKIEREKLRELAA